MPEFNPDIELGASLAAKWETWLSDFSMFLIASGIADETRQRALLLYQAGSRVCEMFKQIPDTVNAGDYSIAKEKLTSCLNHKRTDDTKCRSFLRLDRIVVRPLTNFTRVLEHCLKPVNSLMWILRSNNSLLQEEFHQK